MKIVFEKCDITKRPRRAKCKTEAEIDAWMQEKSLILVINEARFIQHNFGPDRVERKSSLIWHSLNNDVRTDRVMMITRSNLRLADSIYNVAGLMDEKEDAYFVEEQAPRIMTYKNRWQNCITLEMSLTERSFVRTVYTMLDLLKDVGGLFGALAPLCTMLVTVCQF